MSEKEDAGTDQVDPCRNCGSTEVEGDDPMPGDYEDETLELSCAYCGYPRGVVQ